MKSINESQLESDDVYRYQYLTEFIGFSEEDVAAIRAVLPQMAPVISEIVEATYEKMLQYDATARHFLPRNYQYEGTLADSLEQLSNNDEQVKFRKEHLQRYLMNILGHAFNDKFATYLNIVGKMHTPKSGSQQIDVPLVQMNALMGLLSDILYETISNFGLPAESEMKTQRAFQKLLWIQNDFINRHYQND